MHWIQTDRNLWTSRHFCPNPSKNKRRIFWSMHNLLWRNRSFPN